MATLKRPSKRHKDMPAVFFGEAVATEMSDEANRTDPNVRFGHYRLKGNVSKTHDGASENEPPSHALQAPLEVGRVVATAQLPEPVQAEPVQAPPLPPLDHTPTTASYVAPDLRSITLTGPAFALPPTTLRVTFAGDPQHPGANHWQGGVECTRVTRDVWVRVVTQLEAMHARGEFRGNWDKFEKVAGRFNVLVEYARDQGWQV